MRKVSTKRGKDLSPADDYLDLVRRFPLRPIRDDDEYASAVKVLGELAAYDEGTLSPGRQDYLDALTTFVEVYDAAHEEPEPPVPPHVSLRALMENRGMTTTELGKLFGNSKGTASDFLNGKRTMSLKTITKLATFFRVRPAVFLPAAEQAPRG